MLCHQAGTESSIIDEKIIQQQQQQTRAVKIILKNYLDDI
jgi:hypothetical protein